MNDIIQLLPDSVANQIAAGEVIQRPASVIKELVENSIDAGATLINVVCVDSGRTSIQVTDNGKGMSETDARLSFERHATSKIRQADDLFNLHTMGFRGEALASIAAVAQVELRTRRPDDDLGTALSIAGSRFLSQEPVQCPVGCNFTISNLFYNVPVRRKFLKSNTTELNNIVTAFERIALVYPDVAFTLYNNQTELYNLKAGGLRQRIVDVIGKKINQHLLPIDIDTTMCKISGFVGKPESARKKGVRQFFFVNGRYMKHPYFHKAIMTAYERLVPEGEQIPYFIYFTVNPTDIDVNIHPTKTEIKFENEQTVWQILTAAVRDAVGMFSNRVRHRRKTRHTSSGHNATDWCQRAQGAIQPYVQPIQRDTDNTLKRSPRQLGAAVRRTRLCTHSPATDTITLRHRRRKRHTVAFKRCKQIVRRQRHRSIAEVRTNRREKHCARGVDIRSNNAQARDIAT